MDVKEMVETLIWLVIDGLAAVWLLRLLFQMVLGSALGQPLRLMAEALCG